MNNNVLISEMLKFRFGKTIFCTDGQDGILTYLSFDAPTRCLISLAIRPRRFWGKAVYAPFASVTKATDDGLWLNSTRAELAASPEAKEPGVVLDAHTIVKSSSGKGSLALVAVQPESGALAYIVAHNLLLGCDTLLREQFVTALAPGQVSVSADETLLKSLPAYRSDSELQREVDQIVFDLGFLHIDLKGMNLLVLDGVLSMNGNVSSALRGELTYDQVASVEGLLDIKNNLVGDDTLAASIALALGKDERTRGQPIGVYPQLGVVRLSGAVHTPQQKAAASQIARQFAGVRDVVNGLVVDSSTDMLYVMSAPEGGEAKDITPGKFTRHTK
jgi:osmotically-inducible protein OsmY